LTDMAAVDSSKKSTDLSTSGQSKRPRDVRLDFFRGLCLFIIFIAHTYGNPWASWIPARFGFSDATEIFVFCSGMASAIAFGSVFDRHGLIVGLGRVTYRIWQVYWAHVSLFMVAICLTVYTDEFFGGTGAYFKGLQFHHLLNENAPSALAGIIELTWVPPYFDILPMYLVLLCMMPVVILMARTSKLAVLVTLVGLWLAAHVLDLKMWSEPWAHRTSWFFNPFGWQLIFFTGFAFMRGWLPAPPFDRRLVIAAIVYCLVALPLEWQPTLLQFDALMQTREAIAPLIDKGKLGILRYLHFLALAYLAYVAVGEGGRRLKGPIVKVVAKVGQQSLGVFMSGIILSFIAGPFMTYFGRDILTVTIANVGGILALVGIAYLVGWYKKAPWSRPVVVSSDRPGPDPVERNLVA